MTPVFKQCKCCGKQYTPREFFALTSPSGGDAQHSPATLENYWDAAEPECWTVMRQCVCDNTLAVEVRAS